MLTESQISSIIYCLSFIILFSIFYLKTKQLQQSDFNLMLIALFLGAIQNGSQFLVKYLVKDPKLFIYSFYYFWLDLILIIEMVLILIFVERIQNLRMQRGKIIAITFFTGLNVFANLLMMMIGYSSILDRLAFLGADLTVVFVTAFISLNFYRIYQSNSGNITLLQFIASSLMFISYAIFAILDITFLRQSILNIQRSEAMSELMGNVILLGTILVTIGFIGFILVFVFNLDIIYRSLCNIQDLVIFSTSGVALYGIGMNADESSLDSQLLSGFITAMDNFVQEMKPRFANERVKLFESTHRSMDVAYGEMIGVAIVIDKKTYILQKKMREFIWVIEETLPSKAQKNQLYKEFDDELVRSIMKKVFPYLDVDNMDTY